MTIAPRCSAIRVKSSGNCQNVPAEPTCKRSIEAQVTDRHNIFDEEAGPDAIFLPDSRETAGTNGVCRRPCFRCHPVGRRCRPPVNLCEDRAFSHRRVILRQSPASEETTNVDAHQMGSNRGGISRRSDRRSLRSGQHDPVLGEHGAGTSRSDQAGTGTGGTARGGYGTLGAGDAAKGDWTGTNPGIDRRSPASSYYGPGYR